MPEKRMFTKKITESDAFLDMPLSTQCLYFHLNMNADDDGFVNSPKRIMRTIGSSEDDFKLLIAKSFILVFDSGVIVIKHWWMHNTLRNDRYKKTGYEEERSLLTVKNNGAYTLETECKPIVNQTDPQPNLTKPNQIKHKYGEYKNVLLSDSEYEKLKDEFPNDYNDRIERCSSYCASTGKAYKNYLATIRNWAKKDKTEKKVEEKVPRYVVEW